MHYGMVIRLLGVVFATLSLSLAATVGVAIYFEATLHHEGQAVTAFAVALTVSVALAVGCLYVSREVPKRLYRRDALLVVAMGWISASLIGAIPYMMLMPEIGPAKAIFESTSGFTTTGASVLTNLESLPRSILFWRAVTQWIGGLGVVVFLVAILSFLGAGAKILFTRESSASAHELNTSRVQSGVQAIIGFYLVFSLLTAFAFRACGLSWFDAICHMFSTVSTGGFSTRTASIGAFDNPTLEWVMIVVMMIGGTSFLVILRVLKGDFLALRRNDETQFYYFMLGFFGFGVTLLLLAQGDHGTFLEALREAVFQVISISTTSGFATVDYDSWPPGCHIMLVLLMLIGGSSGSTAGGLKVVRVVLAIRLAMREIERAYRSQIVRPLIVNNRPLDNEDRYTVLQYLVLMGATVVGGVIVMAIIEPFVSYSGNTSAVAACLLNIGPGLAEVGPAQTYGFLGDDALYFLSLLMIMGRVELLAILVLFSPAFWRKY